MIIIGYRKFYNKVLVAASAVLEYAKTVAMGTELARICLDMKLAISESEDIILDYDPDDLTEQVYKKAYDLIYDRLTEIAVFARQHRYDIDIASVEKEIYRQLSPLLPEREEKWTLPKHLERRFWKPQCLSTAHDYSEVTDEVLEEMRKILEERKRNFPE